MAKAIVLRADASTWAHEVAMIIRGIGCDTASQISAVKTLLDNDSYNVVAEVEAESAEEIFDLLNCSEDSYMMVSDVIVWPTGKRELCGKEGWHKV